MCVFRSEKEKKVSFAYEMNFYVESYRKFSSIFLLLLLFSYPFWTFSHHFAYAINRLMRSMITDLILLSMIYTIRILNCRYVIESSQSINVMKTTKNILFYLFSFFFVYSLFSFIHFGSNILSNHTFSSSCVQIQFNM